MHEETEFSTQVLILALLYINLYSEQDFRPVTFSYSSAMKYLWRKLLLFDTSFQSFSNLNLSKARVGAVMSRV